MLPFATGLVWDWGREHHSGAEEGLSLLEKSVGLPGSLGDGKASLSPIGLNSLHEAPGSDVTGGPGLTSPVRALGVCSCGLDMSAPSGGCALCSSAGCVGSFGCLGSRECLTPPSGED